MQIIAKCPRCGLSRQFEATAADRRIRCARCRRLFKVPLLDELSKARKIIDQAKSTIHVDQKGKMYG